MSRLGEFLVKTLRKDGAGLRTMKSAMGEGSGSVGGWLVPTELHEDVMACLEGHSILWPLVNRIELGSKTKLVPALNLTATDGYPYFGNFQLSWIDVDGTELDESEPTFDQIELDSRVLSGYCVISNSLLADSPMLEGFLEMMFGRAVAWFTEKAFVSGNGVGQPLGMAADGSAHVLTVQDVAGSTGLKLADVVSKLLPASFAHALWLVHPAYWVKVLSRTAAADAAPPFATSNEPAPAWIYGFPAYPCDKLVNGATANKPCVALVDPTAYVAGVRTEVEVAFSEHPRFTENLSIMRVVARVDGRPLTKGPITLADSTTQVSPFVALLHP